MQRRYFTDIQGVNVSWGSRVFEELLLTHEHLFHWGLSMKSACLVSICYHVLIKFRLYVLGNHQGHARILPYKLEIFKEFLYTFETNIHRSSGKYNIKYIRESSILKIAISKVVFLADRCLGNHLQRYF